MLKAASELSGPSTLTRKVGTVNAVILEKTVANLAIWRILLDDIGKVLSRPREPPVSQEKTDYREGHEICQATPIGKAAIQNDPAIISNQGREWIEVYDAPVTFRHQRFRINDRSQI